MCRINRFLIFTTCLAVPSSKAIRRKKFRPAEMARYCFEESVEALSGYVTTPGESESLDHYKGLLRDTELVCSEDGSTFGTH